jgi:hypothetical protein
MVYLALFLIGVLTDRYVLVILDLLTELVNHKLSTVAQSESIKNRKAELLFQREMKINGEAESNVIGFKYPEKEECCEEYEEEYEDCEEEQNQNKRRQI